MLENESLIHHGAPKAAVRWYVGAMLSEKWLISNLDSSSESKMFPMILEHMLVERNGERGRLRLCLAFYLLCNLKKY